MNKAMRTKIINLAAIAAALLLASCDTTKPIDSSSSSTPVTDSSSSSPSSSTPVIDVDPYLGVSFVSTTQGSATADRELYAPGETVTITITSAVDGLIPAGAEINGTQVLEISNNQVTATMVEGGLVVRPLFKEVLTDVEVSYGDQMIQVEAIANGEYRLDDGEWQDSNIFLVDEHSSHTVYARIGAHDGLAPSDPVSKEVTTIATTDLVTDVIMQLGMGELAFAGSMNIARYLGGSFYDETVFDQEVFMGTDSYYLRSSFADDGTVQRLFDYRRGADGKAYSTSLNYDNTVISSPTDIDFDADYANPFADLNSTLFTRVDAFTLSYDCTADPETAKAVDDYMTTHDQTPVNLFIHLDGAGQVIGISSYSAWEFTSAVGIGAFYCQLELSVVPQTQVEMVQPLELTYNPQNLNMVCQMLRANNYTAKVTVDEDYASPYSTTIEAFGNGALIIPDNGSRAYGYIEREGGLSAFDVTSDEQSQTIFKERFNKPAAQSMAELMPSFDVDPALFSPYGSSTYTLRDLFNIYDYAERLLPDAIMDSNTTSMVLDGTLDINLTGTGVTIAYDFEDIYGYGGTTTIEISKIGSTTSSYGNIEDRFVEYFNPTSWEELDRDLYKLLVSKFGSVDHIPFYYDTDYGVYSWSPSSDGSLVYVTSRFPDTTTAQNYVDAYVALLTEKGFTTSTEERILIATDGTINMYFAIQDYSSVNGYVEVNVFIGEAI